MPEARLDAAAAVRSGEAPVGGGGAVAAAVAAAAVGGGGAGPSFVVFLPFNSNRVPFYSLLRTGGKKSLFYFSPFFLLSWESFCSIVLRRRRSRSRPDSCFLLILLFLRLLPPPPPLSPTSAQETGRRAPWLPRRAEICVFVN